ncbi:helix-turn-helix domain-containing protein [Mycolicibacterium palauense]|uniref:helix-turn-helix domain-containing protein n=1 Tax=Mycolicibacterium palauense TaxID=2034511 RepID=UPI000BFEC9FB|nr:helix-turn-helix transcriptional regulator [Mycolicibacterium palauense]
MTREAAGAAIRSLRESRDLSLADLAAATGVSTMGLSYLERGARKPHKSTVQKVENGLGLPPGTYARLVVAADPGAELAQVVGDAPPPRPARAAGAAGAVVVDRHSDTDVLQEYAEAQLDALRSVIERLPASTSDEYETYMISVITQCVKAEMLAANSWRVAVNAGAPAARPLLAHLHALESTRAELLDRMPGSIGARFDRACADSGLPDQVLATLLGVTAEQLWEIRNVGAVPAGALARIQEFVAASQEDAQEDTEQLVSGRRPEGTRGRR